MEDPRDRTDWELPARERFRDLGYGAAATVVTFAVLGGLGVLTFDPPVQWFVVVGIVVAAGLAIRKDVVSQLRPRGVVMTDDGFRYSFDGASVGATWANVEDVRLAVQGAAYLPVVIVVAKSSTDITIPHNHVPDLAGLAVALRHRAGLPEPA